jgi:uncharacterized protein
MQRDSAGLEILSRDDSLCLLGSVPVGRVVFTDRALPAVQPVNFVLHDGTVVFRTGAGSKLAAATREAIVAFQADCFDRDSETGWSVSVVGPSQVVTDEAELEQLRQLPLRPWAPTRRDHFIRIALTHVTGRRLSRDGDLAHWDTPFEHGSATVSGADVECPA